MHLVQDFLSPLAQETLFTDDQWMAALLRFESGLAQAEADCGLVPPKAAAAVARACAAVQIDPAAFSAHARHTGALGMAVVGPLRQWLLEHEPDMAPWLHWGTTTQDVVDTANSLVTQTALAALQTELDRLVAVLRNMATKHAATPMLARSLLQPAQVTSFGLKCAQTVAALVRNFDKVQMIGRTDEWTSITRCGEVVIAHHDTVIEPGDHVIVFCTRKKLVKKVEKLFQVGFHFF